MRFDGSTPAELTNRVYLYSWNLSILCIFLLLVVHIMFAVTFALLINSAICESILSSSVHYGTVVVAEVVSSPLTTHSVQVQRRAKFK